MKSGTRKGLEVVLLVAAITVWGSNLQRVATPARLESAMVPLVVTRAEPPTYPWQTGRLPRISLPAAPRPVSLSKPVVRSRPPLPVLKGIMGSGGERSALLAPGVDAAPELVRSGGEVNGWRIARVTGNGVLLRWESESVNLLLGGTGIGEH